MGHRNVIAACRILAQRTAGEHQAVAGSNLLHVGLSLQLGEPQRLAVIKQFARIVPQQQIVHALDALARGMQVAADEAVPPTMAHHLHPGQIHLHQRRATPLPGLEQDDAHRLPCSALPLHHCHQAPLRPVEHKWDVAAARFVLDSGAAGTPELKVLDDAQTLAAHPVQRQVFGVVLQQAPRHQAAVGLYPISPAPHPRQRIVTVIDEQCFAPLVLGEDIIYIII